MLKIKDDTKEWYEKSYTSSGFSAQRNYPNEELLRFMGRNLFNLPLDKRANIKILEIGSGSCSNLWMISREGFSAYGIDISLQAVELGRKMLDKWCLDGNTAELKVASMTDLPYPNQCFDIVVDVFSSYCLNEDEFKICLSEVRRVLKDEGRFFSYTPGKKSDAFLNHKPSNMIDASTLSGISRKGSPFYGNNYPSRFIHPEEYRKLLRESGFEVGYLETVCRSYFDQQEIFEHIIVESFAI
jgi:SAM-dependent methyltransferase